MRHAGIYDKKVYRIEDDQHGGVGATLFGTLLVALGNSRRGSVHESELLNLLEQLAEQAPGDWPRAIRSHLRTRN